MIVNTVHCASATDFVNSLLPGEQDFDRQPVLYRGVAIGEGDDEWRLVPRSLREDGLERLVELLAPKYSGIEPNYLEQLKESDFVLAQFEVRALAEFVRRADRNGVHLPELTRSTRAYLQLEETSNAQVFQQLGRHGGGAWPPNELLSLSAQAQHYEIPTRMLDWTLDPNVAMYFAARDLLELADDANELLEDLANRPRIAVWRLDWKAVDEQILRNARFLKSGMALPLTYVTAPTAGTPRLRAQRGVFTLWRPPMTLHQPDRAPDRRPLDEILKEELGGYERPPKLMEKFTLPATEVPSLWRTLRARGIDGGSTYGGIDGAARGVKENALLSRLRRRAAHRVRPAP